MRSNSERNCRFARLTGLLLVLCGVGSAQDEGSGAKPPDPLKQVATAQKLCATGKVEQGVLLLLNAMERLRQLPTHPVRQSAALTAEHLLEKHDPLIAPRRATYRTVAHRQVEIATAYRARKWLDTAERRLAIADMFDKTAGKKEYGALGRARKRLAKNRRQSSKPDVEPQPEPKRPVNPLFERGRANRVDGSWRRLDENTLESAAHDGRGFLNSWLTSRSHEDEQIAVTITPAAKATDFNAGISFGVIDTKNFFCTRLVHTHGEDTDYFEVCEVRDSKYHTLTGIRLPFEPAKDGSLKLVVQVDGQKLRAQVGSGQVVEATAKSPIRGQVGLIVGITNRKSCAVHFRDLAVGPVPEDRTPPTPAELEQARATATQTKITAAVDRAAEQQAEKQLEAAASTLRTAASEARTLPRGPLRDNLAQTIDELIIKVDRVHRKRQEAGAGCGVALAGLADKYAEFGWPRAARHFAQIAAAFDPIGQAARLKAADAAIAASDAALAKKRAAELQPPADDGATLREWFAKGRRLYSRSAIRWVVDGPSARVEILDGEFSGWLPKFGLPALKQAAIHVHLPKPGASAGFCFDIVSAHDFAIAELSRTERKLVLTVQRWRNGRWTRLGYRALDVVAWRHGGWFDLTLEQMQDGSIQARAGDASLSLEKKKLTGTGRYGLMAAAFTKEPTTIEIRAFRFTR